MNEGLEYVLGHKDMCGQKKDEEQGEAEIVEEEEVAKQALNLARGISLPMVLKSAIELNLLEIISAAGDGAWLSPSEIASQLPTKNPSAAAMLDRMLRLLAGFSIVKCKLRPAGGEDEDGRVDYGERVYGMAPVCKFLTENKEGQGSIGPLLMLHHDKVFMESWYHLTDAVLEGGIPFNRAYGMNSFEYMGMNQSFNQLFNRAMSSHTALIVRKIVGAYRGFAGLRGVLVDVGGGSGVTLNIITSKYPNIKGINYDLPHVLKDAPVYPGVEHVSGDMFETVPTGDAIFMKWILHDWSDEWCLKLLKNCHRALPDSGVVIAVESILSGAPDGELTSVIPYEQDLGMLAHNPGGKERTRHEFEALARESGFSRCEVTCCVYNSWVIEFHK